MKFSGKSSALRVAANLYQQGRDPGQLEISSLTDRLQVNKYLHLACQSGKYLFTLLKEDELIMRIQ